MRWFQASRKALLGENLDMVIIIPLIAIIVFTVVSVANASLAKRLDTNYLEERLLTEQVIASLAYTDSTGYTMPNSVDLGLFRQELLPAQRSFRLALKPNDRPEAQISSQDFEDQYPLRGLSFILLTKTVSISVIDGSQAYPAALTIEQLIPKQRAFNIQEDSDE